MTLNQHSRSLTDLRLSGTAPSHGRIAARAYRNETWQRVGPCPLQARVGRRAISLFFSDSTVCSAAAHARCAQNLAIISGNRMYRDICGHGSTFSNHLRSLSS